MTDAACDGHQAWSEQPDALLEYTSLRAKKMLTLKSGPLFPASSFARILAWFARG